MSAVQQLPSGSEGVRVAWSLVLVWEPCGMCWGQKIIVVSGRKGVCGHCMGMGDLLVPAAKQQA